MRAGSEFEDTDCRHVEYELLHNFREPTPETDEDGDAGEVKAKATAEFDAVLAPSSINPRITYLLQNPFSRSVSIRRLKDDLHWMTEYVRFPRGSRRNRGQTGNRGASTSDGR